jgi:hypothetical protein
VVRTFTPLGLILGCWGLSLRGAADEGRDFWKVWGASALVMLALLAGKLHHEYYWLILAPVIAAGLGRGWVQWCARNGGLAWLACVLLIAADVFFARSTWQTPPEWRDIRAAAQRIAEVVPPDEWLVAPEALLFEADRRGCRLEFTPSASKRAAAEWGERAGGSINGPAELIDFYRTRGARFVADLAAAADDQDREALHDAIRTRYKVLIDDRSVLVAELAPAGSAGHVD